MLYFSSLLFILCLVHSTNASIPPYENIIEHTHFAELILNLTERFISPMTNTLNFLQKCTNCQHLMSNFHNEMMAYFLKHFRPLMALQFFNGFTENKPWEYNIYIVDTLKAFIELSANFSQTKYERDFYFLIILTTPDAHFRYRHSTLLKIFQILLNYRVVNAVILNRSSNDTVNFYTYGLFGPDMCEDYMHVYEFNRFSNGHLKHDYLFPQSRFNNFFNCTLQLCISHSPPLFAFYGQKDNPNHTSDLQRIAGIEGELLKLIARTLNFRINISSSHSLNDIDEYGNGRGCFNELITSKADIAIGALSSSLPNRNFVTASLSYHQTPYVFILRSNHCFGPMEQLALPFSNTVWLVLCLMVSLAIIFLIGLHFCGNENVRTFIIGARNQHSIINLITILLGNPITILPQRNFARFLLIAWLLATLVLRTAYQAKMFDSLRTARRAPLPRSLPELIERQYLLLSSTYKDFYPENLTILVSDLEARYRTLELSDKHLTTTALLDTLAYFNRYFSETLSLTCMREPIYQFQTVLYFQKHSIFKNTFELKLQQFISAGITSYIARSYVKRQHQKLNFEVKRLPKLSNEVLKALYTIYYILISLAFFTFILEMLSKRCKRLKIILEWLHQ